MKFAVTEVPATVHVPATSDSTEPGAPQPVVAARQTDVYSTVKLDVTVDSIKLELFTGDSDLVSAVVDKCCMISWCLSAYKSRFVNALDETKLIT